MYFEKKIQKRKMEISSEKKMISFLFFFFFFCNFAQNVDCGYTLEPPPRGGSIEYPQFMFLIKNKKKGIPQFFYIEVGFKGLFHGFVFLVNKLLFIPSK